MVRFINGSRDAEDSRHDRHASLSLEDLAPGLSGVDAAGDAAGRPSADFTDNSVEQSPMQITVVDKRPLLRDCLSLFLSTLYDAPVDGFSSIDEFLADRRRNGPALVLLSAAERERRSVLEDIAALCIGCSKCPILLVLDSCDFDLVSESLELGARGVIPTNLSTEIATEAISLVVAGGTFIPVECMTRQKGTAQPTQVVNGKLTARENEVLALLRSGQQNKQIAYQLGLSEGTIKVHLHNMMKKLETTNRTQMIMATMG